MAIKTAYQIDIYQYGRIIDTLFYDEDEMGAYMEDILHLLRGGQGTLHCIIFRTTREVKNGEEQQQTLFD